MASKNSMDAVNHSLSLDPYESNSIRSCKESDHESSFEANNLSVKTNSTEMLAYDPDHSEEQKAKAWERLVSGAASGMICRTIAQPLDVIKIRFQLQIEPISKSAIHASKYTGISHTIRVMLREEGIRSFWKGLMASQLISICYTPIQFTAFYFFTEQSVTKLGFRSTSPLTHLSCGSLAGMVAIVAAHPFDTLRTRMVGQGEPKLYRNQIHACKLILRHEGISGLYRGLLPNVALVGPQAGATFFSYEVCKQFWGKLMPDPALKEGLLCNLSSGAVSGIFSKSLIYPLDSIKKRLQVQGFEEARNKFGSTRSYRGVIDCTVKICREEGFFGLYKGFLPSIYKAAAVTALNFAIFEYFVAKFKFNSS